MKILITAFDSFGGEPVNPAEEAVKRLRVPADAELVRLTVPTVFEASVSVTVDAMRREQPDTVLCVGQAGGRPGITVERIGINVCDASIPDNAGEKPEDCPVCAGGPAAYFSTLPVKAIVSRLREHGIPASVSNTAGTFVCNAQLYGVLHEIASTGLNACAGFVHLPYIPCQVTDKPDKPSMALETIVEALELTLQVIVEQKPKE